MKASQLSHAEKVWSFLKAPELSLVLAAEKKWEQVTEGTFFPPLCALFMSYLTLFKLSLIAHICLYTSRL